MAVDEAASPGLRERKKQQTRDAIAGAAIELFLRHGFQATTLKQVAEAANVAPRTVSLYFPAKEELVFSGYADLLDAIGARMAAREPGETAAEALGAFLRAYSQSAAGRDRGHFRRLRDLIESEPALRGYERAT